MGDFNGKIGKTDSSDAYYGVVDYHGLRIRNEHGDGLFQFCVELQLLLANTSLLQHSRRLYMRKSCDGQILLTSAIQASSVLCSGIATFAGKYLALTTKPQTLHVGVV